MHIIFAGVVLFNASGTLKFCEEYYFEGKETSKKLFVFDCFFALGFYAINLKTELGQS